MNDTNLIKFCRFLLYMSLFAISFDIFLVFNLGFTFRFAQLLMLFPIGVLCLSFLRGAYFPKPLGFMPLLIWSFFIILFIPTTGLMSRSVGYGIWLVFSIFMIVMFTYYFRELKITRLLLKVYIYSFAFVALAGLIQFLLPLVHLPTFLVQQWWIPDRMPRINGFSYEPSYFATYMLIGWVLTSYLLDKKSKLLPIGQLRAIFLLETLVLIMSSSRMGWMMMCLWLAQYPAKFVIRLIRARVNPVYFKYSLWLLAAAVTGIVAVIFVIGVENVLFLMNGLGIGNTATHSVDARTTELRDTLRIFLERPFIGYSLGGIAWGIGQLRGIEVTTLDMAKLNEGMNIFAEALAASGIFGIIPFVIFNVMIIVKPFLLSHKVDQPELRIWLQGMVYSLVFVIMILQFNQNILRPYLWLHIAIVSALYVAVKREMKQTKSKSTGEGDL